MLGPKELYEVHPLGKVRPVVLCPPPPGHPLTAFTRAQSPTVVVNDGEETVTMAESGAIVEFLIERYGADKLAVTPASGSMQARSDYLFWLHYPEGSAMLPSMLAMVFGRLPGQAPWFLRPVVQTVSTGVMDKMVVPRLKAHYKFIDKSLEGREYFVADKLSGADSKSAAPYPLPSWGRLWAAFRMIAERVAIDTSPIRPQS